MLEARELEAQADANVVYALGCLLLGGGAARVERPLLDKELEQLPQMSDQAAANCIRVRMWAVSWRSGVYTAATWPRRTQDQLREYQPAELAGSLCVLNQLPPSPLHSKLLACHHSQKCLGLAATRRSPCERSETARAP
jgi:hypothetical protein